MFGGSDRQPIAPPPVPEPLPPTPTYASGTSKGKPGSSSPRGFGTTLLTSPGGVAESSPVAKKSLLGQ